MNDEQMAALRDDLAEIIRAGGEVTDRDVLVTTTDASRHTMHVDRDGIGFVLYIDVD